LQQWGLTDIAAALLEGTGPVNVFLAQAVHAGRPFIGRAVSEESLAALAHLFEDREEGRSFAAFIREEATR
jgi:hypothetical protein